MRSLALQTGAETLTEVSRGYVSPTFNSVEAMAKYASLNEELRVEDNIVGTTAPVATQSLRVLFFANTDWYLFNFRLGLARHLRDTLGYEVIMMSPPGQYGPRFADLGFLWLPVEMDRHSVAIGAEIAAIRRLCTLFARLKPDVSHHFTIKASIYGSLAARIAGVPFSINAITGLGSVLAGGRWTFLRPLVKTLMRIALNRTNMQLIAQNPEDFEALRSLLTPPRSGLVLIRGSGVDTQLFNDKSQRTEIRQIVTFLFVGRLISGKGIREFHAAAKSLKAQLPNTRMLVAGARDPGNPGSLTDDEISQWQAEGDLEFLGHADDMVSVYDQADVVVLPTTYGEGVPRALIEAAASGLPLIATDTPGCREIIEHDVNGILVPARDVRALAESMLRLASSAELRRAMGAAGRAKVRREFDEQVVFEKTCEVYSLRETS